MAQLILIIFVIVVLAWILENIGTILWTLFATAIIAVLAALGAFLFKRFKEAKEAGEAGQADAPALPEPASTEPWPPALAQTPIQHIEAMIAGLGDARVQKEAQDCAVLCREILQAAEENGEVRGKLDNFYRHYLPMFEQMLEHYAKCEAAGVLPPAFTQQVTEFLDTMENAMKKLKETAYTSDLASISINMDVLETLYRSDGLLDDRLLGGQPTEEK